MKSNKILKWTPRILTILFILFLSLFSLDAFIGSEPFFQKLLGFLIHLTPTYLLIGILIIAWKKPQIGGILFLGLGAIFTIFFNTYRELMTLLFISGPVFLVGLLFLFNKSQKQPDLKTKEL